MAANGSLVAALLNVLRVRFRCSLLGCRSRLSTLPPRFRRGVDSSGQVMATPQPNADIEVINAPRQFWGDLYHELLRAPWWVTLASIAGGFFAVNLIFAVAYALVGGVANLKEGSYADAFFFSVQTLGTVGYGFMYPISRA